jgi:hypothetical protein
MEDYMKSNTLWPFQALTIYVWSFSALENVIYILSGKDPSLEGIGTR